MIDGKKLWTTWKSTWRSYAVAMFFFLLPWQTIYVMWTIPLAGHASPFGTFGVYGSEVLVLLLLILMVFPNRKFRVRKEVKKIAARTMLVLMTLVISFIISWPLFLLSFTLTMHLTYAIIFFFALLDKRIDLRYAMVGFVAGLVIPSFLGIFQTVTGGSGASTVLGLAVRNAQTLGDAVIQTSSGTRVLRAYGSFPHPNVFGGYLAVGLTAVFGLWGYAKKAWQIIAFGSVGTLLSVTLLLTFSRSAWLGLLLAGIVGLMARKLQPHVARKAVLPVAAVFIGVALMVSMIGGVAIRPGSDAQFEARSIDERIQQYKEFPAVVETRLVFGHGPGTYPWEIESAFPGREWFTYQPIHNVPFLLIADVGILGFAAILYWLFAIDRLNFSRFPNCDPVSAFMMGNVLLVIVFFDHYLWTLWPGLALVVFVMAMTVRLGEA